MGPQCVSDLVHSRLTGRILGAFYAVYAELGAGFLESVYEEALIRVLLRDGVRVQRQLIVPVWFRGEIIARFRADIVVERTVLVELKAVRTITPAHDAQLLNLLKATRIHLGPLLNFGPRPEMRRRVFGSPPKASVFVRGPS